MKSMGFVISPSTISTVLLMVAAFLVGSLWTEVRDLKNGVGTTPTTQTQQAAAPTGAPTITLDQVHALFNGKHIAFGDKNSKVIFTEFSDPSCPYCHAAGGKDPELNAQMGDQFKLISQGGKYDPPVQEMKKLVDAGKAAFIWIYFPGHGNGEMGQKAMYCAFEKGKFWQVHDLLMSNAGYNLLNGDVKNDKTKSGELANFLKSAENPTDMKNCLDSGKYDAQLTDDTNTGRTFGVNGTPGFFINTVNFAGAYSYTDMQSAVASALK